MWTDGHNTQQSFNNIHATTENSYTYQVTLLHKLSVVQLQKLSSEKWWKHLSDPKMAKNLNMTRWYVPPTKCCFYSTVTLNSDLLNILVKWEAFKMHQCCMFGENTSNTLNKYCINNVQSTSMHRRTAGQTEQDKDIIPLSLTTLCRSIIKQYSLNNNNTTPSTLYSLALSCMSCTISWLYLSWCSFDCFNWVSRSNVSWLTSYVGTDWPANTFCSQASTCNPTTLHCIDKGRSYGYAIA